MRITVEQYCPVRGENILTAPWRRSIELLHRAIPENEAFDVTIRNGSSPRFCGSSALRVLTSCVGYAALLVRVA